MKIKIVTPSAAHAEAWAEAIRRADGGLHPVVHVAPLHEVNVLVNGSHPELVVAETSQEADLFALEQLALAHPEIDYVLVSNALGAEALMRMMRSGVREVLPAPAAAPAVAEAVQRLAAKRRHITRAAVPQAAPSRDGRVLAVLSCKGGSGATFVAANLAHLLADGGARRVALIDLNLQFGDAALFVTSERAPSHVADLARNIARLDADLLQSAMLPAGPGLWVLAAPDDPAQATEVSADHVRALLKVACSAFDFVVLDVGRALNAVTLQALDSAELVLPVLQLTLPFIRDGKRLRDVFQSLDYPPQKICWVVNRHEKDSQLTLDDLRRTLGGNAELMVLPNQYKAVAASVNQGVPVATLDPKGPVTRALKALAERVAPAPAKARGGLLSGLFGRGNRAEAP